jgi:hypothetical protein
MANSKKQSVKSAPASKTAKQSAPAQPAQRVISPDVTLRQRIAAAKAHFRMSSVNGNAYVKGQPPKYAKYFQFDNPQTQRKVVIRPGVKTQAILDAIGSE